MSTQIPPKGIPCHDLLSLIPSGCLTLGLFSSPCTWAPSHHEHWRTRIPVTYVGLWYGSSVWFSLHSDHHRSDASLSSSLKCLPSVPNYCSSMGISPLLQFLHLPGCWSSPTHSPPLFPFLPSSYQVLLGSMYSFPVFKDSCPCSAVALWDSLHLKMYSWWSVKREVLFIHLLLPYLVESPPCLDG